MSVLFKALNKAAEDNRKQAPVDGMPLVGEMTAGRRRRRALPALLAVLLVPLVVGFGALFVFPDDMALLIDELTGAGAPPMRMAASPPLPTPVADAAAADAAPAPAAPAGAEAVADPAAVEPAEVVVAPPPPVVAPPAAVAETAEPPAQPAPPPAAGPAPAAVPTRAAALLPSRSTDPAAASAEAPLVLDRRGTAPAAAEAPARGAGSAESLLATAQKQLDRGDPEAAVRSYLAALEQEPGNRAAMFGSALGLERMGLRDMAVDSYAELLTLDAGNRPALANLLRLLGDQPPAVALARLQRLEAAHPNNGAIAAQVGLLQAAQGDQELAIRQFRRATALEPHNSIYRLNLAILYDRAGYPDQALGLYREVLSDPAGSGGLPMALEDVRRRVAYLAGRS